MAIALFVKPEYAIDFQLLGGAWILQIFPAVIVALYTRWFHRHALLAGWLAGLVFATWMSSENFKTTIFPLHIGGITVAGYIGFYAFLVNLAIAVLATVVLNVARADRGTDLTRAADYA